MINNITKQLYFILKENKQLILNPDELSKLMVPNVKSEDAADFMIFQGAIRKVDVGSILLKVDKASNGEKSTAINMAVHSLKANNLSQQQSENIVKMLVIALGWDSEKVNSFEKKSTELCATNSKRQVNSHRGLAICAIVLLGCVGLFFYTNSARQPKSTHAQKPTKIEQTKAPEKKEQEDSYAGKRLPQETSLEGLKLGDTEETMHKILGKENYINDIFGDTPSGYRDYYFDHMNVKVVKGKVVHMITTDETDIFVKTPAEIVDLYGPAPEPDNKKYKADFEPAAKQPPSEYKYYKYERIIGKSSVGHAVVIFTVEKKTNKVIRIEVYEPGKTAGNMPNDKKLPDYMPESNGIDYRNYIK
ncbi:hypothetical protein [Anaerovibrio lipolyticus]|uniref:hypothetical protein n=1 Tax=Anaerovibrio lipolyticus TaxID=82374 RepID=UPI0026F0C3AB|nr:hypothetical protein [Anaerovibrio lipolyticus]MBE6106665.1 hypothetical protein [Anaerovibrio lipolyticus]